MNEERYVPRPLGDGLVVRWSTPDDVEAIAQLSATVFRRSEADAPTEAEARWICNLATGRHPLADPDGGIVVEDTATTKIVASLWALRADWRYGDVVFPIGRPEEVVSDPAYRNRGLIRALFEWFHLWSADQGHVAQAITGIHYFYRRFGYEYAVDLDGARTVLMSAIPALPANEAEPLRLRAATAADLPFVQNLYEQSRRRSLVSSDVPDAYWRWMLDGVDHGGWQGWLIMVAVDAEDVSLGAVVLPSVRWGTGLGVRLVVWRDDVNLLRMAVPLLRALRDHAPSVPPAREETTPDRLRFNLATNDPLYALLDTVVSSQVHPPYAWYVRVPDLAGFLLRIAPVLEERLRTSAAAGFDGELRLDFYRDGVRMRWQNGRLIEAAPWRRVIWQEEAQAGFPPLVFLQLVFGRRSLDELLYAYADVWARDETAVVLRALFPARPSHMLVLN